MRGNSDLRVEDEGVVSFTDETSPHGQSSGDRRVVVAAQFVSDHPLGWYYELVKQISVSGELKAQTVLNRLGELPGTMRERLWTGVRCARIHITDCRPYSLDLKEYWASSGNEYLFRADVQNDPVFGQMLRDHTSGYLADLLLLNSPAEQLARHVQFVGLNGMVDLYDDDSLERTHEKLRERLKGRVKHALLFAARAAAAFGSALDNRTATDDIHDLATYAWYERRRLLEELRQRHAFDRGNELVVETLEGLRADLDQQLDWITPPSTTDSVRLISVDSLSFDHVRAADIAAGLAAKELRSRSLVRVVQKFDYVTYNGARLDEELALKEVKRIEIQQKLLSRFESI